MQNNNISLWTHRNHAWLWIFCYLPYYGRNYSYYFHIQHPLQYELCHVIYSVAIISYPSNKLPAIRAGDRACDLETMSITYFPKLFWFKLVKMDLTILYISKEVYQKPYIFFASFFNILSSHVNIRGFWGNKKPTTPVLLAL